MNATHKQTLHIPALRLDRTFNCGQAFRWNESESGWFGVAGNKALSIAQDGGDLYLDCDAQDLSFWEDYFALDCDYRTLMEQFEQDPQLFPCCEHSAGIRVLRQQPFETLITFIISANNHVPRIRSIIEKLCEAFGEPLNGCFAFPTPEALARAGEEAVFECGAGYRAPYIVKAARAVAEGFDLEALKRSPEADVRQALTSLPGVGPKVAQCVMLFSLGFYEAFPVDVWIRRVLKWLYPSSTEGEALRCCLERFGSLAGVAQQLLFHYARQVKLCKNI